jgi:Flp pilus assembly protein TadD
MPHSRHPGKHKGQFMRPFQFIAFLLCFDFLSVVASAQQPGETVIAIKDSQLKMGDKVVQPVRRGLPLEVRGQKGDWLFVTQELDGYIKKVDVAAPPKALEVFTAQIQQNPKDAGAYVARGTVRHGEGDTDLAINDFNQAVKLNPKDAEAYLSRAFCWLDRGILDRAIADCSEAIRLNPKSTPAYIGRGTALAKKEEFDKAIADFSQAVTLSPKSVDALSHRALAHVAKKDYEKAKQDFLQATQLDSRSPAIYNELAWLCATCPDAKVRDGKKAVESATKAVELSGKKDPEFFDTLAASYAEVGNFDEAVKTSTKAIELAPPKDKAEYQARQELYKAKKPFRDDDQAPRNK